MFRPILLMMRMFKRAFWELGCMKKMDVTLEPRRTIFGFLVPLDRVGTGQMRSVNDLGTFLDGEFAAYVPEGLSFGRGGFWNPATDGRSGDMNFYDRYLDKQKYAQTAQKTLSSFAFSSVSDPSSQAKHATSV